MCLELWDYYFMKYIFYAQNLVSTLRILCYFKVISLNCCLVIKIHEHFQKLYINIDVFITVVAL